MLRSRSVRNRVRQACGVVSVCVGAGGMFLLVVGAELPGVVAFGAGRGLLSLSLLYSLYEIQISTKAINVELSNFEARKSAGREDVDYS